MTFKEVIDGLAWSYNITDKSLLAEAFDNAQDVACRYASDCYSTEIQVLEDGVYASNLTEDQVSKIEDVFIDAFRTEIKFIR